MFTDKDKILMFLVLTVVQISKGKPTFKTLKTQFYLKKSDFSEIRGEYHYRSFIIMVKVWNTQRYAR